MSAARQQLRIHSAEGLFAAIEDSDLGRRVSVLQQISAQPEAALRYGEHGGRDLIDVLLQLAENPGSLTQRKLLLGAVVHYDDPRVVQAFAAVMRDAEDSDLLALAARRLALSGGQAARRALRRGLMRDDCAVAACCAAEAVSGWRDLSQRERCRVALASDERLLEAPAPAQDSLDCWLHELRGPFAGQARELVARRGVAALELLAGRWEELEPGARRWLVVSCADQGAGAAHLWPLCLTALQADDPGLLEPALTWAAKLGEAPAELEARIAALRDAPRPEVRYLALKASDHGVDWSALARDAVDGRVRALAVLRLTRSGDADSDALRGMLEDPDWRVRAAATRALAAQGGDGVVRALRLEPGASAPALAAAAQLERTARQRDEG